MNLPLDEFGAVDFDLNLPLDEFGAIQAIQYKKNAKTINELIPAVQQVNRSLVHLLHCFFNN